MSRSKSAMSGSQLKTEDELMTDAQKTYNWPNFRENYLRTPPSRPFSKMSASQVLEIKREQRMRKINNRNSLIPPWCHSQIEHRQEKKRQALINSRSIRKNMQSAFDYQSHEQVDLYGRVRGKGQRLLSNGQVLPTQMVDPTIPYTYSREEMFQYEPTPYKRIGTPLRTQARKIDPTRPMLNSSGYVMNMMVEHPYFLDVNGDYSLPTPERRQNRKKKSTKIGLVKPSPHKPEPIAPEQAWGIDQQINAKRRQQRSYWQQTSWPGCMYKQKKDMALTQ